MVINKKYYYFITSLAELSINDKQLDFSSTDFREELQEMIDEKDFTLIRSLFYQFDIDNFINLIKGDAEQFDDKGNYTKEELTNGIILPESLVPFMEQFVLASQQEWKIQSKKNLKNLLTAYFIDWTQELPNTYLKTWFEFDHNIKNIVAGLNSRKFHREINEEVLGNHFEAVKIRRNREKDFGLEKLIDYVDKIISQFENPDIAIREFAFEEMRWNFVEEINQGYYFTVENLMTYLIKLQIIERSMITTPSAGQIRFDELLKNIKIGYEIPKEFI